MDSLNGLALILAAASVVASCVAAFYTGWQASEAHASVEQVKQIQRAQSQPYVFADVRMDEHQPQAVDLIVRNQGPTVARNVRVMFDPPLVPSQNAEPIADWTVSALTPSGQLVRIIATGRQFFNEGPPRGRQRVTVSAEGPHGPTEPLIYEIDLAELGKMASGHRTIHHVAKSLEEIAEKLKE